MELRKSSLRVVAWEPTMGASTLVAFLTIFFPMMDVATKMALPYFTRESGCVLDIINLNQRKSIGVAFPSFLLNLGRLWVVRWLSGGVLDVDWRCWQVVW